MRHAQRTVSASHCVGGAAGVLDAEAAGDGALVCRGAGLLLGRRVVGVDLEREDVLLLAAEQREDAVGRQLGERLGEVEVVGELGALVLLARPDAGADVAPASRRARAGRR